MFTIEWTTRRYRLPNLNESELRSKVKSWVKARGLSIVAVPKLDLRRLSLGTAYTIADSMMAQMTALTISFYVAYRAPVLYVFSVKKLPPSCSGIFDEVFTAYARSHGGDAFEETPLVFTSSVLMTSPLSHFDSLQVDYSLLVQLDPNVSRIEAAREEIHIPKGVSVTVKRSRTITHAVEIANNETSGVQVEAGLNAAHIDVLKATVKSEIQKQTGIRFEESETIEHEITLNGAETQNYTLLWADFVRRGIVEINAHGAKSNLPFNWRERTELQVVPA